ncbi:MAG: hypothetical protein PGN08_04730 [Sphingomonas taxi]
MDELPFTPVELVAVDAARNIRRRWRVAACRDLFGHVLVETGWGRIGGRGPHAGAQLRRRGCSARLCPRAARPPGERGAADRRRLPPGTLDASTCRQVERHRSTQ